MSLNFEREEGEEDDAPEQDDEEGLQEPDNAHEEPGEPVDADEESPWPRRPVAAIVEASGEPKAARGGPRLVMGADLGRAARPDVERRHYCHVNDLPLGPLIFLPSLSREVGHHLPVGVTTLAGSPGSAKTALVHQIAASAGCAVVVVTLEMAPNILLDRHIARHKRIALSKLRSGEVDPESWQRYCDETLEAMPGFGIVDGSRGGVSRPIIREAAEIARNEAESDYLVIIIDSAHSWLRGVNIGSEGQKQSRREDMEIALHQTGELAQELNASIFLIAEQSKSSMDSIRQDSAADTRVFAYVSEIVLSLTRDLTIPSDALGEVPILMTISKNRHGTAGVPINLQFDGPHMSFRENSLGGRTIESVNAKKKSSEK